MKSPVQLKILKEYQKSNLRPATVDGCRYLLITSKVLPHWDVRPLRSEKTFHSLELITERGQSTKINRYENVFQFDHLEPWTSCENLLDSIYEEGIRSPETDPKENHLQKDR